eukprot:Gregarina_sp_Pseudo_9__3268@NODE_344_length_3099_cov_184_964379_g324_i0_p1_GENE_NODE_344_length_3099_cov_184_964379_g324_i0NODE_344_length_3099_cov_184_964379_g324_i0_p1_ORF_typecomplete_len482_score122_75Thioredoxin/PF00085_20/5_1e30Thioredoxin/PF00085_20/35Thioredoxin/PF00085_20/1_4e24Thioredoxin_6/PF13848_6/2_3e02Thioredoxin_6/PF13848_6/1_7e07Thioredoxin_6/PF13848_6/1_5e16Thioredoxin_6/PF13848_6/5_4Thioredoxin_7/PF13899_6/3_8e08Thioredoxin_7/PF13899_6/4_6e03Thioredoxin_7/PF13899_6/2_1e08ERp29
MWLPYLALFGCLAWSVLAEDEVDEGASGGAVVALTEATFQSFIDEHSDVLVKFYAPWCGHCKDLAPVFAAAADELKTLGHEAVLAEVDATKNKDLAKEFNVKGYPTLMLFHKGEAVPYGQGRKQSDIVNWVKRNAGPLLVEVASLQEAQSKAQNSGEKRYFHAALSSKDSKEYAMYESAARVARAQGPFFVEINAALKGPATVTVYRPDEKPVSTKILSEVQMKGWVTAEAIPLIGELTERNYDFYANRSSSWFWFTGTPDDFAKHADMFRKVSKNYRTEFNFVWADSTNQNFRSEVVLGLREPPAVIIEWEGKKYDFDGNKWSVKAFTKFVESVKSGKAKRYIKSAPIPETNDGPVKVVVGKQFSDIVLQKDKDVLLKFHAPWCGHCKAVAPIWEELAVKLRNNKNLIVAEFDGTANDSDTETFEYQGFPTFFFVKAGNRNPITFKGERTLENFIKFAQEHATYPIVVDDVPEAESKEEL